MTEGAIPLTEIYAYMQIFEITDHNQRRLFLNRIKILDRVYLDFVNQTDKDKDKDKDKD